MASDSKKLFKPTPEQREQMLKIAAERGIDPSVRDDTNLRLFLKSGTLEPASKSLPGGKRRYRKKRPKLAVEVGVE